MASRKPKAEPIDVLPEGLVAEVEARVRAERAVATKKLVGHTLTRRAHADLEEQLVRKGLERTAKAIRLPLEAQVEALIAKSDLVPIAKVKPALAGATSQAEVVQATMALVRRGAAAFVLRGGKEAIAKPGIDTLGKQETDALRAAVKALGDLVKKVKAKPGQPAPALLRSEVAAVIDQIAFRPSADDLVTSALGQIAGADSLAYVPELARKLAGKLTTAELHEALLAASRAGRIELRPEGGIRTLSAEDARLCVPGPQGTLLSYVRRR